jgi:diguanylate cyclase (GGDEF)-like protein
MLSLLVITVACLRTGGRNSPALPWLAIVAIAPSPRFRPAVIVAGGVVTALAIVAISFGADPAGTWKQPLPVIFDIALVGSVLACSLALVRSDLDHRAEALIDPLTGMLNRHALKRRVGELSAQARVSRRPIAFILGDLDHFKAVNDEFGHGTGDLVLADTARLVRATLRAYDLAYRLGGEEFLVVMPGADVRAAEEVAEDIRRTVAARPIGGVAVTMSLGVSACAADHFSYQQLLARADEALYDAKRSGRNRVCASEARETSGEDGVSRPRSPGRDSAPRTGARRDGPSPAPASGA